MDALEQVDAALIRLRRLWSAPAQVVDDAGQAVEMSSVLVVEGCAQQAAEGQAATVGSIAQFADVTHSTASRLVERAVAAGLLTRSASTVDARRTVLALTPAGVALRARAVAFRLEWLRGTFAGWPPEDARALAHLLGRFADAVATHGGPGRNPPATAQSQTPRLATGHHPMPDLPGRQGSVARSGP